MTSTHPLHLPEWPATTYQSDLSAPAPRFFNLLPDGFVALITGENRTYLLDAGLRRVAGSPTRSPSTPGRATG